MIHSRDQLLDWVEAHAPRPCVRRAMNQGGAVNLGVFDKRKVGYVCTASEMIYGLIGPLHYVWIVEIHSPHNKIYNVVVLPDGMGHPSKVYEISEIPWRAWVGDGYKDKLCLGDCPEDCKAAKLELTRS